MIARGLVPDGRELVLTKNLLVIDKDVGAEGWVGDDDIHRVRHDRGFVSDCGFMTADGL